MYNMDTYTYNMEYKTKKTRETGVLELTSQPDYPQSSSLRGFVPPPEVKFHVFRRLKRGEEKPISIFFSIFLSDHYVDSIANKKDLSHTLKV